MAHHMLSRIANSLFWVGRYLERAEHIARYMNVHYFSSLDAPHFKKKEIVFESALRMVGLYHDYRAFHEHMSDEEVLHLLCLEEFNPVSIIFSVHGARENARGVRDCISSEIWESINKTYHSINGITSEDIQKIGVYAFTQSIIENCLIVNGYIENTLMHDKAWSVLHLGMHVERVCQITRIIQSKLADLEKAKQSDQGEALENYHCMTMLKSAEAYDVCRSHYRTYPNMESSLDLLILNKNFPRSITYNLNSIKSCYHQLELQSGTKDSLSFQLAKACSVYNYLEMGEIEKDITGFLDNTLLRVHEIAEELEKKYFAY